jgi:outer membrane PBP1 activator LpoA protein
MRTLTLLLAAIVMTSCSSFQPAALPNVKTAMASDVANCESLGLINMYASSRPHTHLDARRTAARLAGQRGATHIVYRATRGTSGVSGVAEPELRFEAFGCR